MEEMITQCSEMMNEMSAMMDSNMMGSGTMMDGMMGGMMSMGSGGMMNGMMQGGMMNGFMAFWMISGWLVLIGILVVIVLGVVWVVKRADKTTQPDETPLTTLKRRYAAGEIDADQFEKMKVQVSEG